MTIDVLTAGIQTTLQAGLRRGHRHWGVPWSGPADALSCALANRSIGNQLDAPALEITYGLFGSVFRQTTLFCLMGAPALAHLNDRVIQYGVPTKAVAGDVLTLSASERGVRTYLAISGGFRASSVMNSLSTYLPAALGGFEGRTLKDGDRLHIGESESSQPAITIPIEHHVSIQEQWRLRLHAAGNLDPGSPSHRNLFTEPFTATRRANRMGLQIDGPCFDPTSHADMESVPVFPGTVQCPPDGKPYILLCDAQTTGGYPRLGHIARVDRYKLGQIRPGNTVRFLEVTPTSAARALSTKKETLKELGLESLIDEIF
ncbi:MAG: biotin-dependent carboxyltransferase family protein [Pseudomonadota bacterium]